MRDVVCKMARNRLWMVLLTGILFWGIPAAAEDTASRLADHFQNKTPAPAPAKDLSLNEAMAVQADFVSLLSETWGPIIGYKAGLTSKPVQEKFGVDQPVRGTLLKNMMLDSGAEVPADFGARPLFEGDLMLRVGDEKINEADTPDAALRSIDAAIPFIELPDLLFSKEVPLNGPAIAAVNVGARYGVMGKPIAVEPTPEWADRLAQFTLRIQDEKGTVLAEGRGSNLLGRPLNVVLWIKDSLKAEGRRLKKGDLLSLGTVTKLMPPKAGATFRAVYLNLDPRGDAEAVVHFK